MSAVLERKKGFTALLKRPAGYFVETDKVPEGFKTTSGSYLRVGKDGKVSYHNPELYTGDWKPGSRPFKMSEPKARVDYGTRETFDRIKTFVEKSDAKKSRKGYSNSAQYYGRTVLGDYHIAATNGHVCLLDRGEGTGEYCAIFDKDYRKGTNVCSIDNKEFHLAIKRAALMAPETSGKITLEGLGNTLTISSQHPEFGSFEENLQINSSAAWSVSLDWKYLEPILGTWPLIVRYIGPAHPLIFAEQYGDWAYIVMPISD